MPALWHAIAGRQFDAGRSIGTRWQGTVASPTAQGLP
jgi:hypothetical protein